MLTLLNRIGKDRVVRSLGDKACDLALRSGVKLAELIQEEARERAARGLSPHPDPHGRAEKVMANTFVAELPFGPEVTAEMVKIGMETFRAHFDLPEPQGTA